MHFLQKFSTIPTVFLNNCNEQWKEKNKFDGRPRKSLPAGEIMMIYAWDLCYGRAHKKETVQKGVGRGLMKSQT